MFFWFICLLPNDVIRLFPSYETYFQYLLQAILGTILLYRYKISKNINIFQIILLIWLLLYLPGAFLNDGFKTVTLIKYFCWIIFIWGVLRFFEIEKENEEPVVKVKENPMIMGAHVEGEPTKLIDINEEAKNIIFEVYIFGMETIERQGKKGAFYINNLKVSDKTDSYLMNIVKFDKDENDNIMGRLKVGKWIRVLGSV